MKLWRNTGKIALMVGRSLTGNFPCDGFGGNE